MTKTQNEIAYNRAVNILKPSKRRFDLIREDNYKTVKKAETLAFNLLKTGQDAKTLYKLACGMRNPNETELERSYRVVLLGINIRGLNRYLKTAKATY